LPATGKKTVAVVVPEEDALRRRGPLTISFVCGRPYSLEVPSRTLDRPPARSCAPLPLTTHRLHCPSQPAALTADGSAAAGDKGAGAPCRQGVPDHQTRRHRRAARRGVGGQPFNTHALMPSRPPVSAHGGGSAAAMVSGTCLGWTVLDLPSGVDGISFTVPVKVILDPIRRTWPGVLYGPLPIGSPIISAHPLPPSAKITDKPVERRR
jgi:hypothetical protein